MGVGSFFKSFTSKTLYYAGPYAALTGEGENYKEIFEMLGIRYSEIEGKPFFCGHTVFEAGYKKEARNLALRNYKRLKEQNITRIITSSAQSYWMLKEVYAQLVLDWDIEVVHVVPEILAVLQKRGIVVSSEAESEVVYHDPCYMGRYLGMYDEPRKIIELLGGRIVEMKRNKEQAVCCGAGGGVAYGMPDFAKKMAMHRLKDCPTSESKIISPCALCTKQFMGVHDQTLDFSTFVLDKLRSVL